MQPNKFNKGKAFHSKFPHNQCFKELVFLNLDLLLEFQLVKWWDQVWECFNINSSSSMECYHQDWWALISKSISSNLSDNLTQGKHRISKRDDNFKDL